MIERIVYGNFNHEEDEDYKKLSSLDKQEKCDVCGKEISSVRVILNRGGKWVGVYCSHECSRE